MIQILIADDHQIIREGVRSCLEKENGMTVIGEAETGEIAVSKALSLKPDLVIMDIHFPDITGLEATHKIKKTAPDINVLILSMHCHKEYVREFIHSGAQGYLLKDSGLHDIVKAVKAIQNGTAFFSTNVSGLILDNVRQEMIAKGENQSSLSKREREVLALLLRRITHKNIARQLCIEVSTVKRHRYNMMKKLGVKDNSQLMDYGFKIGLIKNT